MINFTISVAKIKKHRNRKDSENTNKPMSNKVIGLIKENADGFCVCRVICFDKANNKLDDVYPFTPDSYQLYGKRIIFTKEKRCSVYIRNAEAAKVGNYENRYVTVRKNWLCDGWIVRTNKVLYFKLNSILKPFRGEDISQLNKENELNKPSKSKKSNKNK